MGSCCMVSVAIFTVDFFLQPWPFSVPMFVYDLDLHRDVLCSTPPIRPERREGERRQKKGRT